MLAPEDIQELLYYSIYYAIKNEKDDLVKHLCDNQSIAQVINLQYVDGNTLLHHAITSGRTEVIKPLIEAKADLNIKNNKEHTPLYYAARTSNQEIINFLLLTLSDPKDIQELLYCSIYYAIKNEKDDLVQHLCGNQYISEVINRRGTNEDTLLYHAIASGRAAIVKSLIEAGADLNIKNNEQYTPLPHAARTSNQKIIDSLLPTLLAPEDIQELLYYSIYYAMKNEKDDLVQHLCGNQHIAQVINLQDTNGNTLLHHAITSGRTEVIKPLIEAKADLNTTNSQNKTAIEQAILNNSPAIVYLLLKAGASFDAQAAIDQSTNKTMQYVLYDHEVRKCINNKDFAHNALYKKLKSMVELHNKMISPGQRLTRELDKIFPSYESSLFRKLGFKMLKQKELDILCCNMMINTYIKHNDLQELKALFSKLQEKNRVNIKTVINSVGLDGKTPLHEAILIGNAHMVKFLLENGAKQSTPIASDNAINYILLYDLMQENSFQLFYENEAKFLEDLDRVQKSLQDYEKENIQNAFENIPLINKNRVLPAKSIDRPANIRRPHNIQKINVSSQQNQSLRAKIIKQHIQIIQNNPNNSITPRRGERDNRIAKWVIEVNYCSQQEVGAHAKRAIQLALVFLLQDI